MKENAALYPSLRLWRAPASKGLSHNAAVISIRADRSFFRHMVELQDPPVLVGRPSSTLRAVKSSS
jgi:hypothetical protein